MSALVLIEPDGFAFFSYMTAFISNNCNNKYFGELTRAAIMNSSFLVSIISKN